MTNQKKLIKTEQDWMDETIRWATKVAAVLCLLVSQVIYLVLVIVNYKSMTEVSVLKYAAIGIAVPFSILFIAMLTTFLGTVGTVYLGPPTPEIFMYFMIWVVCGFLPSMGLSMLCSEILPLPLAGCVIVGGIIFTIIVAIRFLLLFSKRKDLAIELDQIEGNKEPAN